MPDRHPEFTVRVAGLPYRGWTEVECSRSIERMGGEFTVSLAATSEAPSNIARRLVPGQACTIEIDDRVVLDGYIDACEQEFDARNTGVRVRGRDKTGDLIDCAASTDGPFEFAGQKLEAALRKILAPYGIPLVVDADTGKPFERLAIQPGETAYEFIDRACRQRAVLPVSDGVGGLAIVKPGSEKSTGRLVYGDNILRGSVSADWRERFSLYVVKGQGEGFGFVSAEEASTPEGRASDKLVTRHRPKVVLGENQAYDATLKERAEWEAKVARARSLRCSYGVAGWYADRDAKALWLPNTSVVVQDKLRGVYRTMLITAVTYRRSSEGTTTDLQMTIPEAFDLLAEKQPETDDLLGAL